MFKTLSVLFGITFVTVAAYLLFYTVRLTFLRNYGHCVTYEMLNTAMYGTPFFGFIVINLSGIFICKRVHYFLLVALLLSIVPFLVYAVSYRISYSLGGMPPSFVWMSLTVGEVHALLIGFGLLIVGVLLICGLWTHSHSAP